MDQYQEMKEQSKKKDSPVMQMKSRNFIDFTTGISFLQPSKANWHRWQQPQQAGDSRV